MNGLREKFRNKKGFTLIEMLIVVAIIAILIAVSIPLVGSALEKARDATDQANERAAKAEAAILYLEVGDNKIKYTGTSPNKTATLYYDAKNGSMTQDDTTAKAIVKYGQCTGCSNTATYPNAKDHTNAIIKAVVKENGEITISWVTASTLAELT